MDFVLSKMDPRELPKGTRDPLGFEIIWTTTGRKIIGNLTTITRSIEEFITALVGFYLCVNGENEKDDRDRFIRFEQVAAYLRYKSGDENGGFIRGSNRVRVRSNDENTELKISTAKADQILSNQSAYGLWGLYSTVLESTGLTKNRKVTSVGKEIIEELLSTETSLVSFLREYIDTKETMSLSRDDIEKRSPVFANLLQNKDLRRKLLIVLLRGVDSETLQEDLFNRVDSIDSKELALLNGMWELISYLKRNGDDLGETLEKIQRLDRILTTANSLFNFLRVPDNDSKNIAEILPHIESKIETPIELDESLSDFVLRGYSDNLHNYIQKMNQRKYGEALINLLEHHREIMSSRKSAPWIEIVDGYVKVKVEESNTELDFTSEKHSYGYFLDSYLDLFKTLARIREGVAS